MRSNPVYGKSLLIVPEHKIYVQIYPYMGNVEENEGVNCCETFAFKYIIYTNIYNLFKQPYGTSNT